MINTAKKAKNAFLKSIDFSSEQKNKALQNMVDLIKAKKEEILFENKKDLDSAWGVIEKPLYERLKLSENKLRDLIQGLEDLIKLPDPVNKTLFKRELNQGLILEKVSTPIGVIGVIFEARPDCFIQISSLIIKSGNTGILKGGIESKNTNKIFYEITQQALDMAGFPEGVINIAYLRDDVSQMLKCDEYIDLIIPRGSNSLVKYIKENTRIPVLGHSSGICHIFLDKDYDDKKALSIIKDAKTQYPSACNSTETLLIHKDFIKRDELIDDLEKSGIEIIKNPESYSKEYSDTILSVKIVNNLDEAIGHINKYSSHHTDTILSENAENIEKFLNLVDSSSVFSNCSTRFADGFRYGFGAEVGISTNKTHARGPVGLEGLTIYKYKLRGSGDIVSDYAEGIKTFTHKNIEI